MQVRESCSNIIFGVPARPIVVVSAVYNNIIICFILLVLLLLLPASRVVFTFRVRVIIINNMYNVFLDHGIAVKIAKPS